MRNFDYSFLTPSKQLDKLIAIDCNNLNMSDAVGYYQAVNKLYEEHRNELDDREQNLLGHLLNCALRAMDIQLDYAVLKQVQNG